MISWKVILMKLIIQGSYIYVVQISCTKQKGISQTSVSVTNRIDLYNHKKLISIPLMTFRTYCNYHSQLTKVLSLVTFLVMTCKIRREERRNLTMIIVIYLDFHTTKRALWFVDSYPCAPDQIQMYPDQDTIAQLLPMHRIQQHVFAMWLFKGKSKCTTKHLMNGPLGN